MSSWASAPFDQCDLLEEELEAAQSKASNKDAIPFFRLGNGRASRSKAVSLNQVVSLVWFLSVPLELIVLNAQAELFWAKLAGADAPQVDSELAGHRHDGFFACRPGGQSAFG